MVEALELTLVVPLGILAADQVAGDLLVLSWGVASRLLCGRLGVRRGARTPANEDEDSD
jgi:hypothetical protein